MGIQVNPVVVLILPKDIQTQGPDIFRCAGTSCMKVTKSNSDAVGSQRCCCSRILHRHDKHPTAAAAADCCCVWTLAKAAAWSGTLAALVWKHKTLSSLPLHIYCPCAMFRMRLWDGGDRPFFLFWFCRKLSSPTRGLHDYFMIVRRIALLLYPHDRHYLLHRPQQPDQQRNPPALHMAHHLERPGAHDSMPPRKASCGDT